MNPPLKPLAFSVDSATHVGRTVHFKFDHGDRVLDSYTQLMGTVVNLMACSHGGNEVMVGYRNAAGSPAYEWIAEHRLRKA